MMARRTLPADAAEAVDGNLRQPLLLSSCYELPSSSLDARSTCLGRRDDRLGGDAEMLVELLDRAAEAPKPFMPTKAPSAPMKRVPAEADRRLDGDT